ncbi:hypothetical protein, partial [Lacisediminimonas sp.]|uniref:hypothetical protein n=1 Tax=Lacisediminimonas sp. TaxID=3060582 RepID=UPI00271DC783
MTSEIKNDASRGKIDNRAARTSIKSATGKEPQHIRSQQIIKTSAVLSRDAATPDTPQEKTKIIAAKDQPEKKQSSDKNAWSARLSSTPHAQEEFMKSSSVDDKKRLTYCVLREAGLPPKLAAERSRGLPPEKSGASYAHWKGAKANPDLKHDDSRVKVYCAMRALGYSKSRAAEECKFGPYFLQAQLENKTEGVNKMLAEYGLDNSSLTYPRMAINVSSDDMPVIGSGAINTIYKIQVDGKFYAFKPSTPSHEKDENAISPAGQIAGIQYEKHFPELRHISTVKIGQALGCSGKDGVIGDAFVAIVNGKPGLMMDLVPGSEDAPKMILDQALPKSHKLYKYKKSLDDPKKFKQICKKFGYHSIKNVNGVLIVSASQSNELSKAKYASPTYRRSMLDLQLLGYLANTADAHGRNILSHKDENDDWHAVLIDCDDSLGEKNKSNATVGQFNVSGMAAFFGVPRPTAAMKESADRLADTEFDERIDSLKTDLHASAFPKSQIDAMDKRINLLRENLKADGDTEIISSDERLSGKKFGNPRKWTIARNLGMEITAEV